MTIERAEKQNRSGSNPSTDTKDKVKEIQGVTYKADSTELRTKVKEAIKAIELCYNYETGFHYIKQ